MRRHTSDTVFAPVLAVAIIAALAPAANAAEPPLSRVSVVEAQPTSDGATITIRGDRKLDFALFRLESPTRIVIDVVNADVAAASVPSRFADDGFVTAVTTTQFRGKNGPVGRVVVVLRGDAEVDARPAGNDIIVVARKVGAAAPTAAPATKAAPAAQPASDVQVIELVGEDAPEARASKLLAVEAKPVADGSVVRIKTDGEIARYEVEEAADPARLVIDLFGIAATGNSEAALEGAIAKARIGKHSDKARIVLEAKGGVLPRYDVASTGEGLAIMFGAISSGPRAAAVELGGMTFDKKNGFWRLKLDTGSAVAVRTVKNAPDEKIIALDGVRASKLLGAHAGDGPVSGITLSKDDSKADSVRVRLALGSDVEHSVWQRDGAVFWDVRQAGAQPVLAGMSDRVQPSAAPLSTATLTLTHEGLTAATFRGKKITIDLMEADIVNVIRLLGDVSGKNVVVSEDVKGKVTLKLKNVPWDQALDVILKTKDLGQETKGGIIRVVPQAKLDAERDTRLKQAEEREKKLPTTVRLIPVNYAVAQEMVPQVKGLLSQRGTVTSDARTNVLIVEDIRDNLEQAEKLVRTLDTQTPQVLIEARMVEGTTNFTRSLGIQWGGGLFFSQRGGNPTGLIFPNNVGVAGGADNPQVLSVPGVFQPSNFAVNLPAQNVTSGVGVNLGSIGNFGFLNARLTAAEQQGQAKVVSAPRITTLNNKAARITQGTEFNFATVLQNQVTITNVKAALELDVTPHVTADGSILMQLTITNNVPDFGQVLPGAQTPPVSTKEAKTEMLVRDGDTAVIGGIYTRTTAESTNQTPFLGSIPILGWLFKSYSEQDARSEMLVFISPRIVNRKSATIGNGGL